MAKTPFTFWVLLVLTLTACAPAAQPTPTATAPVPTLTVVVPTVQVNTPTPTTPPTPTADLAAAGLSELVNKVEAKPVELSEWESAAEGQKLYAGDSVRTGAESAVRIDLADGSLVRLAADTLFEIKTLAAPAGPGSPVSRLVLLGGKIFIVLGELLTGSTLEVETPVGSASVRGSLMGVVYDAGRSEVVVGCLEGHCTVSNETGEQALTDKQQSALVAPDQPPAGPQPLSAELLQDFSQIPEAQPALLSGEVILPDLPCLADRSCDTYCAPRPGTGLAPADCDAAARMLMAQGVDFNTFRACYSAGGDPQTCATDNRRQP